VTAARVHTRQDGRLAVDGVLSFDTVPALLRQSRESFAAAANTIEIDLTAVGRADSAGLALLLAWTRRARAQGKSIRFTNAPPQILRLVEVNKLTSLLPLEAA
jgi:phospholipid transport system transporter-binding protein